MPAIEITGLTKRFGDLTAVDRLDLTIEEGEVYGLLGPNGAGKTTVIRILVGLAKPTEGRMTVMGRAVGDKDLARHIGYMPQELALYEALTVEENLDLFGGLFGLDVEGLDRRKAEVLDFVALSDRRYDLVQTLSGGMRHRVSLALTLLHEPDILFLDEPTVGVDPELRASFWDNFGRLKESGKTVVITTHYMDEAKHCDRIGLMHRGGLVAEGQPAEVVSMSGAADLEGAFLKLASRKEGGG
ncbi:MAG: ABC transporter ATP-binding protein [Thermoplasmata archaeon]|nr:MAG: ABC transporter ATP-binding protein [Thermoplasmata archaeon]